MHVDADRALWIAHRTLIREAMSIIAARGRVDKSFPQAVELIMRADHVAVAGIGKSGLIARRIAATFSATGTPAFFLHPVDALHGDLGAVTSRDLVLLVSNSGETVELASLLPHLQKRGIAIIALTGVRQSRIAKAANVHLDASVSAEACPLGLVPTASAAVAAALGDALAMAILDARGFTKDDFARHHPGGALGRALAQ